MQQFRSPVELYTARPDGSELRQITTLNGDRLAAVRTGEPSQFTFIGAGGDKVYGWIVKPADFDPMKKYPVAFLIHGGPQGSWANDFHYRWNPQTYAGAGYAVVMVDFHGSTGTGRPSPIRSGATGEANLLRTCRKALPQPWKRIRGWTATVHAPWAPRTAVT